MQTVYETLTPELAASLLASVGCEALGLTGCGRLSGSAVDRFDEQRVDEIAWAIASGAWSGCTTIEVDENMRLVSGRRRCAAVVRANTSIPVRILRREP
jgi:hypothetical protein